MNRLEIENKLLNELISLYQLIFPSNKYIQTLYDLGIINKENNYYENSYDTIIRILPKIKLMLTDLDNMKPSFMIKIRMNNIKEYLKELNLYDSEF